MTPHEIRVLLKDITRRNAEACRIARDPLNERQQEFATEVMRQLRDSLGEAPTDEEIVAFVKGFTAGQLYAVAFSHSNEIKHCRTSKRFLKSANGAKSATRESRKAEFLAEYSVFRKDGVEHSVAMTRAAKSVGISKRTKFEYGAELGLRSAKSRRK